VRSGNGGPRFDVKVRLKPVRKRSNKTQDKKVHHIRKKSTFSTKDKDDSMKSLDNSPNGLFALTSGINRRKQPYPAPISISPNSPVRIMIVPDHLKGVMTPIHPKGWPFIGAALVLNLLLALFAGWLFWPSVLLTAWVTYFFRDPKRVTPEGPGIVVSPADGVVQAVGKRIPPKELELSDAPMTCISVFMNVFDVHVNRTPVPGVVTRLAYHPGLFLNAALDKASDDNERQSFRIRTPGGEVFGLVQIAGLVARRIVAFVEEGHQLAAGERVGLIRFGSRCDVYLPDGFTPLIAPGQRAIAGETVLADGRRNDGPGGWSRG
jgi:phosphatidylserine decarboxylase